MNQHTFMSYISIYYHTFTGDFLPIRAQKSGCTCPKAHATAFYISFYYYCLSKLTFTL